MRTNYYINLEYKKEILNKLFFDNKYIIDYDNHFTSNDGLFDLSLEQVIQIKKYTTKLQFHNNKLQQTKNKEKINNENELLMEEYIKYLESCGLELYNKYYDEKLYRLLHNFESTCINNYPFKNMCLCSYCFTYYIQKIMKDENNLENYKKCIQEILFEK
jgi:hypothetical protein